MEPLVSILIPAFNAEPWLADAIRSAINQTWPRKEIVVVNDGSTDRTLDVARQFERSGVRVASQANQGAAAARNHALSLSRGDYIQWLDADDILDSTKIARQMAVLAGCGSPMTLASCAWGTFLSRRHRARFVPTSLWCDLSPVDWLLRKMNDGVFMQTAAWLVSRPLTEAAGPWDTRLLTDDDGEYFCRVLLRSDGVRHVPDAKVYYRATGPGRLSYVGRDQRKVEMMFLSIELHINYVLAVENTERVRAACVRYLQNHLVNFYPGQPDILARAQRLAGLLGGKLEGPSFEPKYAWIDRVAGPHVAKSAQLFFPRARWAVARPWDEALSRIDRPDTHSTSTEAYFGVGDRPDELPVAAVRGGAQVVLAQVFSTVVRVVSSVVLAHLLMPADFGMVAMVIGVTAGLMIFKDLGLCDAIIQWPNLTHVQVSSLFWVNVGVSLTVALGRHGALAPDRALLSRAPPDRHRDSLVNDACPGGALGPALRPVEARDVLCWRFQAVDARGGHRERRRHIPCVARRRVLVTGPQRGLQRGDDGAGRVACLLVETGLALEALRHRTNAGVRWSIDLLVRRSPKREESRPHIARMAIWRSHGRLLSHCLRVGRHVHGRARRASPKRRRVGAVEVARRRNHVPPVLPESTGGPRPSVLRRHCRTRRHERRPGRTRPRCKVGELRCSTQHSWAECGRQRHLPDQCLAAFLPRARRSPGSVDHRREYRGRRRGVSRAALRRERRGMGLHERHVRPLRVGPRLRGTARRASRDRRDSSVVASGFRRRRRRRPGVVCGPRWPCSISPRFESGCLPSSFCRYSEAWRLDLHGGPQRIEEALGNLRNCLPGASSISRDRRNPDLNA